jgi:hypothetical protein
MAKRYREAECPVKFSDRQIKIDAVTDQFRPGLIRIVRELWSLSTAETSNTDGDYPHFNLLFQFVVFGICSVELGVIDFIARQVFGHYSFSDFVIFITNRV